LTHYTAEEVEQRYIDRMGQDLGETFYELFNECCSLHLNWKEYDALFGKEESRVVLLNNAAAAFFRLVQDTLWENTLLRIARLTDAVRVGGGGGRETLTLLRLPQLVDVAIRPDINGRVQALLARTAFARDWRHRHIAHNDLRLALDRRATPLTPASRRDVRESLQAIADVLNAIQTHYCESAPVPYDVIGGLGDAETLLQVLGKAISDRDAEWAHRFSIASEPPAE
jgi:hypothetical protein